MQTWLFYTTHKLPPINASFFVTLEMVKHSLASRRLWRSPEASDLSVLLDSQLPHQRPFLSVSPQAAFIKMKQKDCFPGIMGTP